MTSLIIIGSWAVTLVFARVLERTWWMPGSLLALVLATSAVGTRIFAPEYYESLPANMLLQAIVAATVVGSVVGQSVGQREFETPSLVIRRRRAFILFGMITALISLAATLIAIQIPATQLFSPTSIMRTAQAATKYRYTEGFDFPIYSNIANALVLTYAVIASIHFAAARRIDLLMLAPIMVFGFTNLLVTTRSPILFVLIMMMLGAIYAHKLLSSDRQFISLFSRRYLKIAALSVALIVVIFFAFQVLRFGEGSQRSVGDIWMHLRRWPWGSLPGFSLWFDGYAARTIPQPAGFYTFMGVFDNLGIAKRVVGGYSDYVNLTPQEPGNIFTAFRGMIQDFGELGTILGMMCVGFLGGAAAAGRTWSPITSLAVYVGVMSFVGFSFVVSAWAFTSNIIALVVLPPAFALFSRRTSGLDHSTVLEAQHG